MTDKTAQDYRDVLRKEVCEVIFTKKNGDERNMFCSLHPDILPENVTERDKGRTPSETVVNVWDLEADDWRCFRVDSVKEFNVVTETTSQ